APPTHYRGGGRMNNNELPEKHAAVWHTLQSLEDGVRITGEEIMHQCDIEERRDLYHIIEDLRRRLFFVASSKNKNGGYYEARDAVDVAKMLSSLRKPAISSLNLADKLEKEWMRRQYGDIFEQGEANDEPENN